MKRLFLIFVIGLTLSCSFDNKTGIWKDASNFPVEIENTKPLDNTSRYEDILIEENQLFNEEKETSNISGIKIEENDKTFYWSCIYTDNFKERITTKTELNVMANFNPVIPNEKSKPDILLLGNLHPEIQLSAINQLNNKPSAIILDTMNYWIENFWETVKEVISKVDIISINDEESEMITGQKDLSKAANILHAMGPKFVIIKKGKKGAELFNYEKRYVTGVFDVEKVLDPTGAGDCFIGGISGFLSQSDEISFESIKSAIDYGTSLASFNVEEMGTKNLLNLSMNDIQTRVNKLR